MDNRNRDLARLTAAVAVVLCLLVGCYAQQSQIEVPEPMDPPSVNLGSLTPPLVVHLERTADWDKPVVVPVPELDVGLAVAAPVIPLPDFSDAAMVEEDEVADTDAVDLGAELVAQDTPDVVDLSIQATELLQSGPRPGTPAAVVAFQGAKVEPGQLLQTNWTAGEALHGAEIPTPILVARGTMEGPTLCVTAAVHGDELNGI